MSYPPHGAGLPLRWLLKQSTAIVTSLLIGCASAPTATRLKDTETTVAPNPASGSLLERALRAPAADLASSYYVVKYLVDRLPPAGHGTAIGTPGSNDVGEVKAELERRLAIYATAINHRGYKSIAGTYLSNATASCANVPSLWALGMLKGELGNLDITQNGFIIRLVQQRKNNSSTVIIPGVIVESSLVLADPANFDFRFRGEITSGGITLRPDVKAILAAWPAWMEPPNRTDLSSCGISLAPGQTIVPFLR